MVSFRLSVDRGEGMDRTTHEIKTVLQGDLPPIVQRWLTLSGRICWQLSDGMATGQLRTRAHSFLQALQRAVSDADDLGLGGVEYREAVQHLSFLAGWMAGQGFPISASIALCHGLRELLSSSEVTTNGQIFFRGLVIVVAEAHCAAQRQKSQAWHRQMIEKSQVVCFVRRDVVALFLVGDPDTQALDDAVGRLAMAAIMKDATSLVVDASGLVLSVDRTRETLEMTVSMLATHQSRLTRRVFFSGLSESEAVSIDSLLPAGFSGGYHADFAEALEAAEQI